MIVVADTGPLNYLLLSGHGDLLPALYDRLLIPTAVHTELLHPKAPHIVRQWARSLPPWAQVRTPQEATRFPELGLGESQAIALAVEVRADFLLIDETQGRTASLAAGVRVKGTLGVLEQAADRRLVDLPAAVAKLQATGIFLAEHIVQKVLERHRDAGREPS